VKENGQVRCRVAACREPPVGVGEWCFYLINDGDVPLASAALYRVTTEWGDFAHSQATDLVVTNLAPGAHALIWRDDGECRTGLSLLVCTGSREVRLDFEFPKLYIQRNLQHVDGLGKLGWEESAEG
jgi:hypothetical protein